MLDLTGENLVTYVLRELKDIVNRNPRFRNLGGEAIVTTANLIAWNDLQVEIGTVTTQGTRLSPDYFMCTQHGHAILCKLEGKNGTFVDWVWELRNQEDQYGESLTYPVPGVYYLNVDSVDEGTREVGLTVGTFKWGSGRIEPAKGSGVYFRAGIDVSTVTPTNSAITYVVNGNVLYITSYTNQTPLQLQTPGGPLIPNTDFWYYRDEVYVLTEATLLGVQDIALPIASFLKMTIEDQNGYVLVDGRDFQFVSATRIRLGQWTPPDSKLIATFTVKANPTSTIVVQDENKLPMIVGPDETLTEGQVYASSSFGQTYTEKDLVVAGDGSVWLGYLLRKGEKLVWEARVSAGEAQIKAKKLAQNPQIIPGLMVGIGDQVEVGDQCAIMVSPDFTETYEVYGSKENISFDIHVRANDRLTASDIATSIRSHLLVQDRLEMESNGLTIFEISKSSAVEQKGSSGVATMTTYTLSVSAAADWELYVPLTIRIGYIEINEIATVPGWSSASPEARLNVLGKSKFIPSYA